MVTWSDREITCSDLAKSDLNTHLLFRDTAWTTLLQGMLQPVTAAASLMQVMANPPSGQTIHPISPYVPQAQPRA